MIINHVTFINSRISSFVMSLVTFWLEDICSSCKIHLNFLLGLHGHANADTLTHSNTNLFHAKKIPMWQSCCGLWTTYFVLGNQESYNSEQWMRHEQIIVGFSQISHPFKCLPIGLYTFCTLLSTLNSVGDVQCGLHFGILVFPDMC